MQINMKQLSYEQFAFFALTCSLFLTLINICHKKFHISIAIAREVQEVQ
jgi:hypothetical protein